MILQFNLLSSQCLLTNVRYGSVFTGARRAQNIKKDKELDPTKSLIFLDNECTNNECCMCFLANIKRFCKLIAMDDSVTDDNNVY
jgi:hypothetical protein